MKYYYHIQILDVGNHYTFEIHEDADEYVTTLILACGDKYSSYQEAFDAAIEALKVRGIDTNKKD